MEINPKLVIRWGTRWPYGLNKYLTLPAFAKRKGKILVPSVNGMDQTTYYQSMKLIKQYAFYFIFTFFIDF